MLLGSVFSLPLSLKKKPEGNFVSGSLIINVANQNSVGKKELVDWIQRSLSKPFVTAKSTSAALEPNLA